MKRIITLLPLLAAVLSSFAQDVKVEFLTPRIVHVVKGQPTKTLVVTAQPEQVAVSRKGNTLSSAALTVKQDAQGNLTFLTAKGKVLLREKSCDVRRYARPLSSTRTKPSMAWAPSRTAR